MVSVVEVHMDMLQDLVWRSQSEKLYGPNEGNCYWLYHLSHQK